jgi:hypothetical protein
VWQLTDPRPLTRFRPDAITTADACWTTIAETNSGEAAHGFDLVEARRTIFAQYRLAK